MGFKRTSAALSAVCIALTLSSCGGIGPAEPEAQQNVLKDVPTSTSEQLVEAAKTEGSVLWYSSKPSPIVSAISEAFQNEYGIRVETYKAGGSQVLSKVESELSSGGLRADVVDYSDAGAAVAQADRGVFAQYAPERASLVPEALRSAQGFWTFYGPYSATIAYNPSLVTDAEAPKSWSDLKDEKWRGKIGMASPDYAGSAVMTLHGWEKQFGEAFISDVGPNIRVFQGFGDVQNALLSGQVPVAVVLSFRALTDEAGGAPIRTVRPDEGEFLLGETAAVNKSSAHPNAARLFMNFLLEEPAQKILADAYLYPAVRDVPPHKGVTALDNLEGIRPDVDALADPAVVLSIKKNFKNATK